MRTQTAVTSPCAKNTSTMYVTERELLHYTLHNRRRQSDGDTISLWYDTTLPFKWDLEHWRRDYDMLTTERYDRQLSTVCCLSFIAGQGGNVLKYFKILCQHAGAHQPGGGAEARPKNQNFKNTRLRTRFTGKKPGSHCTRGLVRSRAGAKNLALTHIRSSDRAARSMKCCVTVYNTLTFIT